MAGKAVIVSAPSGAGKTSIVTYLTGMLPGLEFSVSATTRKPRGTEVNGKEYYFISVGEFREKIKKNEFAEWEEVYTDNYYGTLKDEIERIWSKRKDLIFDVDVNGGISLKKIFGEKAISIFIMPPSLTELENRLVARGTDNGDRIRIRIGKAMEEIKLASDFDHIVVNEDLETARTEVFELVSNFLKR